MRRYHSKFPNAKKGFLFLALFLVCGQIQGVSASLDWSGQPSQWEEAKKQWAEEREAQLQDLNEREEHLKRIRRELFIKIRDLEEENKKWNSKKKAQTQALDQRERELMERLEKQAQAQKLAFEQGQARLKELEWKILSEKRLAQSPAEAGEKTTLAEFEREKSLQKELKRKEAQMLQLKQNLAELQRKLWEKESARTSEIKQKSEGLAKKETALNALERRLEKEKEMLRLRAGKLQSLRPASVEGEEPPSPHAFQRKEELEKFETELQNRLDLVNKLEADERRRIAELSSQRDQLRKEKAALAELQEHWLEQRQTEGRLLQEQKRALAGERLRLKKERELYEEQNSDFKAPAKADNVEMKLAQKITELSQLEKSLEQEKAGFEEERRRWHALQKKEKDAKAVPDRRKMDYGKMLKPIQEKKNALAIKEKNLLSRESLLAGRAEELEERQKKIEALEEKQKTIEKTAGRLEGAKNLLAAKEARFERERQSWLQEKQQITAASGSERKEFENRKALLEAKESQVRQRLGELDEKLKTLESKEENLRNREKDVETSRQALAKAKEQLEIQERGLDQKIARLAEMKKMLESERAQFEKERDAFTAAQQNQNAARQNLLRLDADLEQKKSFLEAQTQAVEEKEKALKRRMDNLKKNLAAFLEPEAEDL